MFQNDKYVVLFVTFYLLIYCELLQYERLFIYAFVMFVMSPYLVAAMVYVVIKHGHYSGPALDEKEFGYQDRSPDELGVF